MSATSGELRCEATPMDQHKPGTRSIKAPPLIVAEVPRDGDPDNPFVIYAEQVDRETLELILRWLTR